MAGVLLEIDKQNLPSNIRDLSDEEQQPLMGVFGLANTLYLDFVGCIPQAEKSGFAVGDDIFSALGNCTNPISELSEDLEAYCLLLSLSIACRFFRLQQNIEDVDPNLSDDLDRNQRVIDISAVSPIVEYKIEQLENLEFTSKRQVAILQISYLILAEIELSVGDPDALAIDFMKDASRVGPIEFGRQELTFDQRLRIICLQVCGYIELFPKVGRGWDYIWDLTDNEWLQFWSALIKTQAISNEHRMLAGIPERLLNEIFGLLPQSPLDADTLSESGESDSFNDSLRDLLELPELFRDGAFEIDILDAVEPRNSDPKGSAYWCWMSGHLIGIVAKSSGQAGINKIISDSFWFGGGISPRMTHGSHVFSLFSECVYERDWAQFKLLCMQAWASLPQDQYSKIDEITPATRSYWAMRIGICDAYLDGSTSAVQSPTLVPSPSLEEPPNSYIWSAADERLTAGITPRPRSFSLEELRDWHEGLRDAQINPSREFVTNHLGDVLTKLDSPKVERLLSKGEFLYQTAEDDMQIDDAKLSFTRAIEGTLLFMFTKGFIQSLKNEGNISTKIVFAGRRNDQTINIKNIRKFTLHEWSDAFRALDSSNPTMASARDSALWEYLEPILRQNRSLNLRTLARELQKVHEFRNSAAHFNDHEMLEEEPNLKHLRDVVLGVECKSLIQDLVEWFQPIDDSPV